MPLTAFQKRMPQNFKNPGESDEAALQRWENTVSELKTHLAESGVIENNPETWPRFFTLQNAVKQGEKYTDNWMPAIDNEVGDFSFEEGVNTVYEGNEFNPYAIARALYDANRSNSDLMFYTNAQADRPYIISHRSPEEINADVNNSNTLSVAQKEFIAANVDTPWRLTQWCYDKFGWFKDRVEPYYRERGLRSAQSRVEAQKGIARGIHANEPEPEEAPENINNEPLGTGENAPVMSGRVREEWDQKIAQKSEALRQSEENLKQAEQRLEEAGERIHTLEQEKASAEELNKAAQDLTKAADELDEAKWAKKTASSELSNTDTASRSVYAFISNADDEIKYFDTIKENQARYFGSHPKAHDTHYQKVQDKANNDIIDLPEGVSEEEFIISSICAYSTKEVTLLHEDEYKLSDGNVQPTKYEPDEDDLLDLDPEDRQYFNLKPLSEDIVFTAKLGRAHIKFDDLLSVKDKIVSPGRTNENYIDCFNRSRHIAADALTAYKAGDKTKITEIFRDALQYHSKAMQVEPDITNGNWINNALVLKDMAGFLKNHPDVFEELSKTPADREALNRIVASNNVLDVLKEGAEARYQLMNNPDLSRAEREKYAQKFLAMRMLKEANQADEEMFRATPEMIMGDKYLEFGSTSTLKEAVTYTRPLAREVQAMNSRQGAKLMKQELYDKSKELPIYKDLVESGKPLFSLSDYEIGNMIRAKHYNHNRYVDYSKNKPAVKAQENVQARRQEEKALEAGQGAVPQA